MSTTSLTSKQKVGLFLKRNFHSMNSLIENPTEFKWLGLAFQDGAKESSVKFEAEFNDNSNIEYNSDNKEYIWYKNINLPKIKVQQCSFYPVDQLKAEIMIFGGILSGDFSDVDIKGKNFFNFHLRESTLKGIRVGDTSHNLKGKQLHIVISISSFSNPLNIHYLLVSSGMLVYGRKKKFCQRIDTGLLIEPFLPCFLREERDQNESIQGLFSYLTSKKLRHKILHPLFLFLQFPKVFELYYNKNIIKSENNIAYKIQNLLIKKKLQPKDEEFLIIRVVIEDSVNLKEYFSKECLIDEYRGKFKDISNIKMKYMKKLMIHPHRLEQVYQDGYSDSSNDLSSFQSSGKSYIKDPFSVSIINLNMNESKANQQLIKIEAQRN